MAKKISELPVATNASLTSNARLLVNEVDAGSSTGYTSKQVSLSELNAELASNYKYVGYAANTGFFAINSGSSINIPGTVPSYSTSTDNGKVLSVGNTALKWTTPSSGGTSLPTAPQGEDCYLVKSGDTSAISWYEAPLIPSTYNANDGDILIYNNGELAWGSRMPDSSDASNGDVLKYSSSTGVYWGTVSAGIDSSSANNGDVLCYSSSTGIYWGTVFAGMDSSNANDGDVLKYGSSTGVYWGSAGTLPDTTDANHCALYYSNNTGLYWAPGVPNNASDGDVLCYSSNTGCHWDKVFPDYSYANNGDVLKYGSSTGVYWGSGDIDTTYASSGDVLKYGSSTGVYWGTVLPDYGNDGNVLTLSDNGPEWASVSINQLLGYSLPDPDYTSINPGEVLVVGACGAWEMAPAMPNPTYANPGDILMIDEYGYPQWTTPSS